MNLREQGIMFTETSFGEDISGIKDESFMLDFDLDIGKFSVSPPPYQSSCVAADISSLSMVESDVLGSDLLSAFDSFCGHESLEPKECVAPDIKSDTFDSVGQAYLSRQCPGDGNDTSDFGSSGLAVVAEPSAQGDGEANVLVGIDKTRTQSRSLIVYTSSRRRSARNTKSSQMNVSPKPSKCRRAANKSSEFDLSSLQILRRSRSLYAKRARSSVWGDLGNILPDIDQSSELDKNLGNERKQRREKGGKGKRKGIKDQTGKKSIGKKLVPTGHISLKVKIGNKICSAGNVIENFSAPGKEISGLIDTKQNKLGEEVSRDVPSPCERNLEKVMSSGGSALSTNLQVRGTFCNQSFDTSSNFHEIRSLEEGDHSRGLTEIQCSDVGTSPDSEVINSIPDVSLCEKGLPDLHDGPILSQACVSPMVSSRKHSKKGKKKVKLHQADNSMLGSNLTGVGTRNNATAPASMKDVSSLSSSLTKSKKGRKKDKLCEADNFGVKTNLTVIETLNKANGPADLGVGDIYDCSDVYMRTAKPNSNGEEMKPCSGNVVRSVVSNTPVCDTLIPCSNSIKFPKCSSAKGSSKGRSGNFPNEKEAATKNKGNKNDLDGNETPFDLGGTEALINGVTGSINKMQFSTDGVREQYDPPRNAWVLCDVCQKWRRIQAALADEIEETNCGWTCQDNTDKDFADCSIPQEKSNSEINEELEISDGSCEEGACGTFLKPNQDRSKAAQQSSWTLIKSNLFMHRSRKTQTIDEVMVCHCKPPSDGRMGCGAKCLNRMLNIECVQGTCPCGELCSNQQFQKRKYSKLKWFRCGKKGYGLQALEDMPQGQFLIEYVGEVLDVRAYETRQREYGMKGHRHFYFMTLNGSEVIDACAKGNLGRFINHSCDPNCCTEKWMVNGEVCIGLFALRDIKKGEEVTFDYNFVRVFGAAAKKCECGSANCRGYIGGDLTNSEVIAQDDSDDEYTEPVMICEGDMNEDWNDIIINNSSDREDEIANEPSENIYVMKKLIDTVGESIITSHTTETSPQKAEGVDSAEVAKIRVENGFGVYDSIGNNSDAIVAEKLNNNNKTTSESLKGSTLAGHKVECEGIVSQIHEPSQVLDITSESDGIVNKAMPSAHKSVISVPHSKSLSGKVIYKRNLKCATGERRDELSKSNFLTKTNRSSSIKKAKPKLNALKDKVTPDVDKLSAELHKSKKLPKLSLSHHLEAVEEKLNELLDPEGGISKRKDASRGYLKLLFLTAATGNIGHGEAIQSNRDLSMILDALLKTKSRTVLVDVINKNGLQMLHNILKRYRKEFIKTPILRKLLKVLEYLATREILTLEHITGGPACPGVESFKDSVLTLTEHTDRQVHQIARNFRDRWIPRSLRKTCCMERDDGVFEYHQPTSHGGLSASYDYRSDRGGKPTEATNSIETLSVAVETSTLELSASGSSCRTSEPRTRKRKSRWDSPLEHPHSRNRNNSVGDDKHNDDEDIPPGFSTPCNVPMIPSDASSTATDHQEREMQMKQHSLGIVLGDPLSRFSARMPVTYGVPYSVMQQFEVPQAQITDGWTIAPGVPFLPFPPLPPCAPVELDRSTSARCASSSAPIEMAAQSSDTCLTNQADQQNTKTFSKDSNDRPDFQQGGSCSLGRKFFRQQKWNHSKSPPWVRMRNGWGPAGNNARNGSPGVGLANGANDIRNSCISDEDYRREF